MEIDQIRTVGICGIGQMGSACAIAFQRAGYRVLLWARDEKKLSAVEIALDQMNQWCDEHIGPTGVSPGEVVYEPDLAVLDYEADCILDCIVEIFDEKVSLLRRFESAAERRCLFLSATSALSPTELAAAAGLDEIFVVAHFWNPPHIIPVVEMVPGKNTDNSYLETSCELMRLIGKRPVVCKDVPGFVGNRLLHALWREALALIDQGVCSPADLDEMIKLTFALRLPVLGPLENMDYVGLDATERLQRYLGPHLASNVEPSPVLTSKLAEGQLGVKSGHGFYDWSSRNIDELLTKRDAQVLRQVQFLKELGDL